MLHCAQRSLDEPRGTRQTDSNPHLSCIDYCFAQTAAPNSGLATGQFRACIKQPTNCMWYLNDLSDESHVGNEARWRKVKVAIHNVLGAWWTERWATATARERGHGL